MKLEESAVMQREWDNNKDSCDVETSASEAALGALLEEGEERDAERRVRQLGGLVARLDALNVAGMLAAATDGGGAELAARLDAGQAAGTALTARLRRCELPARAAPDAAHARSGAARADANARALLAELEALRDWLEPPPLQDLEALQEVALGTAEGRARALAAAISLRTALRGERTAPPYRLRLAAVRDRLHRLGRVRDQLAGLVTRHLNNVLIHLGNEAAAAQEPRPHTPRHHADLLLYAPFMRWLKDMDDKAFDALLKVYVGTWSRVYEREVMSACECARAALASASDEPLDNVLSLVESLCDAEQDFCTQFFFLDIDTKQGEPGEEDSSGGSGGGDVIEGSESGSRRATAETRRLMNELFPGLETELVTLVQHLERLEPYGAMRALACAGRRALAGSEETRTQARWSRAALATAAVAAKRGADRAVADRLAALPDAVRQAARRPKCGLFSFVTELEKLSEACESVFVASGRRADLDRWYLQLSQGMMQAIQQAEHPRTPRAVLHMENYHRLHGSLSSLRARALDAIRRDCKARYHEALRAYVTQYFPRPLEKLAHFFEGVAEAVATGVREDEVCYRAAFSKHELRRVLSHYPAAEVRKSLHRLYRTVEKHLSEESGLLQVVWRAMQEEFIAQHVALQGRITSCYGAAGLTLPLTTQDILDAFSDIAREH